MALGIFNKQEDGVEHLWSLVIGKTWVQAAIWRVVDEAVEVVSEGSTASWQDGNDQSLIEAVDGSLSAAAASIGDDVAEPNKVVFGLSPSWIQDGSIVSERLGILKKLSDELELTPAGFVVVPEAITHYLKSREGAPLNAILVGLAEDSVDVTLVQNGRALQTVEVAQSISLGSDLSEGLARLPQVSQYPSRILLYDHKVGNLEDARQNLLDTNWDEVKISFLHTPKVEILGEDIAVAAVSLAGGAEVGQAKTLVLPQKERDEEAEEESTMEVEPITSGEVGDLADPVIPTTQDLPTESEVQEISPEELGFLQGTDVSTQVQPVKTQPTYDVGADTLARSRAGGVSSFLAGLGSIFSGFRIPTFGLGGTGVVGVVGVLLLLLLIVGGLAYWYLPKAEVTIFVAPRKLEKTFNLTVDPKLKVISQAEKIIPGTPREFSVTGDKTTSTSGTVTVGERAKGQVAIYHIGGSTVLKSGLALAGPGGLKFTLDNDVTVASSSGITSPSKTQASVSAGDIGAQYNLASGSKFSVGNFSKDSFEAQNDSAMSGGTSRAVSAVSEEDRANLEKELTAELLARGQDELKNSLAPAEVLITDAATLIADTKIFSHKVGEETSTLKLSLSGKVSLMIVSQDDVNSLVMSELEKDVPGGFTLRQDQTQISYKVVKPPTPKTTSKTKTAITPTTTDPNKPISLSADVVANLLPKIDPGEIARAIAGKQPTVAREYLATIPGFKQAEMAISLSLPGKLGTLPRIAKNIVIEIASEQ